MVLWLKQFWKNTHAREKKKKVFMKYVGNHPDELLIVNNFCIDGGASMP